MARSTLFLLVLVCMASVSANTAESCAASSGVNVTPLVELYTSEGCSSCPPADRWLSRRLSRDDANFLAFHVDYWDDIGWPDRYASPRYSQRQRERVDALGQRTVYTPQVMVGDTVQARWRDEQDWQQTLQQARLPAHAALSLRLRNTGSGWRAVVAAAPAGDFGEGTRLWLARYVDAQASVVLAGENRGTTLHHDRVVRELAGPWPLEGGTVSHRVVLPDDNAAWGVTAFVQDRRGRILQSLSLPSSRCAAPGR